MNTIPRVAHVERLQSLLAGESADIDTIVAELDRRAEADPQYKWDVWRTAMKPARWCVKIDADTIDDTSLPGVLRQALHYRAVISIPRRPEVYRPEDFAVVRDGSKWAVKCRGRFFFGNQPTKRRAAEAVERMCSISREQADEWDRLHGPTVAAGTEGIDYRYQP